MQQQLDHRSLACRVDLAEGPSSSKARVCPAGEDSEQVAAVVRLAISHAIAFDLSKHGSSLTADDLQALREGRRIEGRGRPGAAGGRVRPAVLDAHWPHDDGVGSSDRRNAWSTWELRWRMVGRVRHRSRRSASSSLG